ncbi:MAG: hypothetical protein M1820_009768 [Bogoriella megaspora]|nr:MAG: hypothetical protein M1820_009768 [Bogoriella megaspora]
MSGTAIGQRPEHRRTKSSVLRSMMVSRNHTSKQPSEGATTSAQFGIYDAQEQQPQQDSITLTSELNLPQAARGELQQNFSQPSSPKKNIMSRRPISPKKTGSSTSIYESRHADHVPPNSEKKPTSRGGRKENDSPVKPKKSKSSTSLSSIFLKSKRSSKNLQGSGISKEKENTTPPASAGAECRTPIWAQFATTGLGGKADNPVDPFSPVQDRPMRLKSEDSPSKDRPTGRREGRPQSDYLQSSSTMKIPLADSAQRHTSGVRTRSQSRSGENKRGSRVMAAVAAITNAEKIPDTTSGALYPQLTGSELDAAFEAVLNQRNVPENMRAGMRSLTERVKLDFIANSQYSPPSSANGRQPGNAIDTDTKPENSHDVQANRPCGSNNTVIANQGEQTGKHTRSRSRTFNFSKNSLSPSKKRKQSGESDRASVESVSIHKSSSSKSLVSLAGSSSGNKTPKTSVPEEFVQYLRKVQRPENVEVGKMHKLRLLLRNETVAWVDDFIQQDGMTEIVGLLNRVMHIEWREEHEDQLLHEVLLCVKGICTTELALTKLFQVADVLFPALIQMLFDEEKKGPAEFVTRGIVINLLFTHLTSATPENLAQRAHTILKYLRDPQKPEESRPFNFILDMHQSRPYRVWCKELVSITKEVFWIFLHNHNVIPLAKNGPNDNCTNGSEGSPQTGTKEGDNTHSKSFEGPELFVSRHFPKTRPPVPAAPYIGGVEWDATTYIASHLDLMNGLIASLPTSSERNQLRKELRDSGFEKCTGISLRTCKEKFYGAVHDCLRTWVKAAAEDEWPVDDVRFGPKKEEVASPKKSPAKKGSPRKKDDGMGKLNVDVELPKLDLGLGIENEDGFRNEKIDDGGWL